ncbi:hypothetical protein KKC74_03810, partial [bacterium]|nr:hypothetical protein [bacterium]
NDQDDVEAYARLTVSGGIPIIATSLCENVIENNFNCEAYITHIENIEMYTNKVEYFLKVAVKGKYMIYLRNDHFLKYYLFLPRTYSLNFPVCLRVYL